MKILIALSMEDTDYLIGVANSNCRCAKIVECGPNSIREGCARHARNMARMTLASRGILPDASGLIVHPN